MIQGPTYAGGGDGYEVVISNVTVANTLDLARLLFPNLAVGDRFSATLKYSPNMSLNNHVHSICGTVASITASQITTCRGVRYRSGSLGGLDTISSDYDAAVAVGDIYACFVFRDK